MSCHHQSPLHLHCRLLVDYGPQYRLLYEKRRLSVVLEKDRQKSFECVPPPTSTGVVLTSHHNGLECNMERSVDAETKFDL